MSLSSGAIYIGVTNIEAAVAWYKEKFELRESPEPIIDGEPGDMELVSRNGAVTVTMTPDSGGSVDTPMFNTGNARQSPGVAAGAWRQRWPVQTDGQGTRYVEMRDPDNNMIEICEEP